jgi:hypothetical protein
VPQGEREGEVPQGEREGFGASGRTGKGSFFSMNDRCKRAVQSKPGPASFGACLSA